MNLLFVCLGNSFRSVIAEKLAEHHLAGVQARSAGIDPADEVSDEAASLLRDQLGLETIDVRPKPVTQELVDWAGLIVVMEAYMESRLADEVDLRGTPVQVWDIEDAPPQGPHEVYDQLEDRITALHPEDLQHRLGE